MKGMAVSLWINEWLVVIRKIWCLALRALSLVQKLLDLVTQFWSVTRGQFCRRSRLDRQRFNTYYINYIYILYWKIIKAQVRNLSAMMAQHFILVCINPTSPWSLLLFFCLSDVFQPRLCVSLWSQLQPIFLPPHQPEIKACLFTKIESLLETPEILIRNQM